MSLNKRLEKTGNKIMDKFNYDDKINLGLRIINEFIKSEDIEIVRTLIGKKDIPFKKG